MKKITFAIIVLLALSTSPVIAETKLVDDIAAYQVALNEVQPGDTILLKNGEWADFEILFEALGTADKPIRLAAQTPGKVFITGQSNLRLAGEYLEVSGLVFKNGYTPTSSVIAFRRDEQHVANNSRVTATVIDGFNNPERYENESWVMLYGKHNRFDHNHLVGKSTRGVTLAVRLNSAASQQNHHRIDHNYFGPRPILGSNGGETLRIGTSHYSLTESNTVVENNYFDRCDGELEIISNKAGGNKFIGNVFYQSRGTLTMRHGNDTLVEKNVFLGNGADHTGGIRVINKRQTVRNNYLQDLKGYRFGGALVVMNGVPNSKINRYHQVEDSVIENNTFVNSDHIQIAAGSDFERTAVPVRTGFKNNLIYVESEQDPFTIYDDVSGITWENNLINTAVDQRLADGFVVRQINPAAAANGLQYPKGEDGSTQTYGVSRDLTVLDKSQTGVDWYPKLTQKPRFDHGATHQVRPGLDTLATAARNASDGDVLLLSEGEYQISRIIHLDKAITVQAQAPGNVTIRYERAALFELGEGGSLKLDGVRISGSAAPDSAGNSVVRTQRRSMLNNYELVVQNSEVVDLNVNHSFNFLTVAKGTFAQRIRLANSRFSNVTGAILGLDHEYEDFGIYNAEYVTIDNVVFDTIDGDVVDYYRGGTDESTFGPHFTMTQSTLNKVGTGKRNKSASSVLLHGVQVAHLQDNKVIESAPITINHTVGEPVTKLIDNRFVATPKTQIRELYSDQIDTAELRGNVYQSGE
ncbi:hypothetical protein GCM10008090_21560 [Arenicella chitinivorans]|uniref:Alginate lyase n=1 Tax=Arenicella chitinivorans TaxID=1329800 RepID=A0A918VNX9_9GAMM|nr:polysaccharide lyase 6 family protein [Arenicella chitinivorans]GHA11480.1 hypothetical protein GCM10008090_21560 [Arenicella chitinivorans]